MQKKLISNLVEKCTEIIDGNNVICDVILSMQVLYNVIVLFVILFKGSMSISSGFVYCHWYLKRNNAGVNTNTKTLTY